MSLAKSLLIGAGLSLLASPVNAEWIFRIQYVPTSMSKVSGTYSCVGVSSSQSQCTKINGNGEKTILLDFETGNMKRMTPESEFVNFPQEVYDRGIIAQPLGKQDLAKFINETSP